MTAATGTSQLSINVKEQAVLVAVDFSDDSKAALVWACNYAERIGSSLILLHVVHDSASQPGFYRKKKIEPMQSVAEVMMAEFLEKLKLEQPDLGSLDDAELRFVPGLPPSRIVEVAGLLNVSLIAMGGRGTTSLEKMLLGSVAERVVKLAPGPVVVVKSETVGKLKKKEIKRREKKLKKERSRLKEILDIRHKSGVSGDADG